MDYLDFVVQLRSAGPDRFGVSVHGSPAGDVEGTFSARDLPLEWSREAPQCALRDLVSDSSRRGPRITLEEMGRRLYRTLFPEPVLRLFERSLEIARAKDLGLRLHIFLDPRDRAVRILQGLPWELLFRDDTEEFLSLSRATPVVRSLSVPRSPGDPGLPDRLRILAARALPRGAVALDLEREIAEMLAAAERPRVEVVTWKACLPDFREALEEKGPFQVLHFLGHGDFSEASQEGALVFEDDQGFESLVSGTVLARKLNDFRNLSLVVLNACRTGRATDPRASNAFGGVAAALVQAGFPAVLAMQEAVQDLCAIEFSRALYRQLGRQRPLEVALAEARQAVFDLNPKGFDWAVPSLFLRTSRRSAGSPSRRPRDEGWRRSVREGVALFLSGDCRRARQQLQRALRRNPGSEEARLYETLSRMALAVPVPAQAAQEIDAALQPLLSSSDREIATVARLALGILRLDLFQPRRLRASGTPSESLFADLERSARTGREIEVARVLRASRKSRVLFNLR